MQLKFNFNKRTILQYKVETKNFIGVPKKGDVIEIDSIKYEIVEFNAFNTVISYKVEKCEK